MQDPHIQTCIRFATQDQNIGSKSFEIGFKFLVLKSTPFGQKSGRGLCRVVRHTCAHLCSHIDPQRKVCATLIRSNSVPKWAKDRFKYALTQQRVVGNSQLEREGMFQKRMCACALTPRQQSTINTDSMKYCTEGSGEQVRVCIDLVLAHPQWEREGTQQRQRLTRSNIVRKCFSL